MCIVCIRSSVHEALSFLLLNKGVKGVQFAAQ